MTRFYAADCDPSGGIYLCTLTDHGVKKEAFTPLDRPMYFTVKDGVCHALLRAPFENSRESGYVRIPLAPDGSFAAPGEVLSTRGIVACHLSVVNGAVYAANYTSGSVIKLPDLLAERHGKGAHPTRQNSPHTHMAIPTPDKKFLAVTDLGTDEIVLYDFDLRELSRTKLPPGSGPRHLVFSPDGTKAYCSCELSSEAAFLSYQNGVFTYLFSKSTLPEGETCQNAPAAIRLQGDRLFVSNRGHDSIAVFDLKNPDPPLIFPSGGKSPWDFDLSGDTLFVCNHKSGSVAFFSVNGTDVRPLPFSLSLHAPICLFLAE